MLIKRIISGPLYNNCYVIYDEMGKDAAIIDVPEGVSDKLMHFLREENLKVTYIINTHGHFDHIYENSIIREFTGAKIVCHEKDKGMLADPQPKGAFQSFRLKPTVADVTVKEGDQLKLSKVALKVMHTPGHTPGSICIYCEEERVLFTGDTLFKGTYGRTDLRGGNDAEMKKTLQKLAGLPKDVKILPGHDEETTIGEELYWLKEF
ncbi:MBL fold metallo-hydrolase [Candidatus Woesearchaeota archaeon]|nr:MBL fold metallo-hydrolase [Candidatus Woesearchaeota archaeon]